MKAFIISFRNDRNNEETIKATILANSEFEAKLSFIYKYYGHINIHTIDTEKILEEYYEVGAEWIYFLTKNEYSVWLGWQQFIDLMIKYPPKITWPVNLQNYVEDANLLKKVLNYNKTSFKQLIKIGNNKFLKKCILKKWIQLYVEPNVQRLTYVAINRILKKVVNTKYWNIYRLILF